MHALRNALDRLLRRPAAAGESMMSMVGPFGVLNVAFDNSKPGHPTQTIEFSPNSENVPLWRCVESFARPARGGIAAQEARLHVTRYLDGGEVVVYDAPAAGAMTARYCYEQFRAAATSGAQVVVPPPASPGSSQSQSPPAGAGRGRLALAFAAGAVSTFAAIFVYGLALQGGWTPAAQAHAATRPGADAQTMGLQAPGPGPLALPGAANAGAHGPIAAGAAMPLPAIGANGQIQANEPIVGGRTLADKQHKQLRELSSSNGLAAQAGRGSKDLLVFASPTCPACQYLEEGLAKLPPDVRPVLLPIGWDEDSVKKSVAVYCAKEPLSAWRDLLAGKTISAPLCEEGLQKVRGNLKLFGELGFAATPTLIDAQGRTGVGAGNAQEIEKWARRK